MEGVDYNSVKISRILDTIYENISEVKKRELLLIQKEQSESEKVFLDTVKPCPAPETSLLSLQDSLSALKGEQLEDAAKQIYNKNAMDAISCAIEAVFYT